MNFQDFLNAGYRKYKEVGIRHADFLLQKRIYDVIGTKYFLNVYVYSLNSGEGFEAEVHFTKNLKLYSVVFWQFELVKEVEKAFEEMWDKMRFDYKERNN